MTHFNHRTENGYEVIALQCYSNIKYMTTYYKGKVKHPSDITRTHQVIWDMDGVLLGGWAMAGNLEAL